MDDEGHQHGKMLIFIVVDSFCGTEPEPCRVIFLRLSNLLELDDSASDPRAVLSLSHIFASVKFCQS